MTSFLMTVPPICCNGDDFSGGWVGGGESDSVAFGVMRDKNPPQVLRPC